MQLFMQEPAPQLCFDFEIERSEFETDMTLKATLGETVTTMLKHSNGKGHMSDVSATISTGSFGEIALADPVFVKTETGEEISETRSDVKQNIHDTISLTPAIKTDPGRLHKSDYTELLYVEWTLSCPSKWNVSLISSSIQDNQSSFQDEFSIDFVYNETSSRLIIHTTTQRFVFRSFSSLEVAVNNLLGNIFKVSNINSTELEDFSVSVLIMTKPEEGKN
ncbi:unnamed protein product [Mytilus edulis]|uniref:Uncharacterized protein n=1 Tax=Mytilus edulis TaxID=6550 RepID=A0A8S3RR49_MYTED|nr:unnamed protein product [Mytilus edulis]